MRNSRDISVFEGISAVDNSSSAHPELRPYNCRRIYFLIPVFLPNGCQVLRLRRNGVRFLQASTQILSILVLSRWHICANQPLIRGRKSSLAFKKPFCQECWVSGSAGYLGICPNMRTRYSSSRDTTSSLLNVCAPTITEVIPNWVDLNVFNRQISGAYIRTELGVGSDQKLILTLGGAAPIKGTLDLLKSVVLLQNRADYFFAVAGVEPPDSDVGTLLWKAKLGYSALRGIEGRA